MDMNEKFNRIIEEGKIIFITEQKEKLANALKTLLKHSLNNDIHNKSELLRFFHSLKGAGASFKLYDIANIGKEYEDYLNSISNVKQMSDSYYAKILKGIALVSELLEQIVTSQALEIKNSEKTFNKELLLSTYITKEKPPTILIIDDDISILNQTKLILKEYNYDIITSSFPEEYLELIYANKIDFILLDIILNNTSGLEFLKQLKKSNINVPTILITGDNDTNIKLKAYETGAEDYITKPFDFMELQIRVNRVIKNIQLTKDFTHIDKLTSAYNKGLLFENIKIAQHRYKVNKEKCSLCLIDLDSFDHLNKLFGNDNGDLILKKFVLETKQFMKNDEQIYRLDEDEFLILLPNTEISKAFIIIEKLRQNFAKKEFFSDGIHSVNMLFSAGVTELKNEEEVPFDILKRARIELKNAKATGVSSVFPKDIIKSPIKLSKKKVIIIDDMNSIIYLLKKQLEELSFEVGYATDGEKGLTKVTQEKPDLVLLDLMLPKVHGQDVLKSLKSLKSLKNTKIIIITSTKDQTILDSCFAMGADSYIKKPISLLELQTKISALFD